MIKEYGGNKMNRNFTMICLMLLALTFQGCSRMYFNALESVAGVQKRDILKSRIEKTRDSQEEAKEQFESALERFMSIVKVDAVELESKYNELKRDYEQSESKAQEVRNRIDSVEEVAEALFQEWERELEQYDSDKLRRASERQLRETRDRYKNLHAAMKKAESKMDPVLDVFHDQVLFLKHNLNAQAVASLEGELASIETDVAVLIEEMEKSISEADEFILSMN